LDTLKEAGTNFDTKKAFYINKNGFEFVKDKEEPIVKERYDSCSCFN